MGTKKGKKLMFTTCPFESEKKNTNMGWGEGV